jgi:hypothetical protein
MAAFTMATLPLQSCRMLSSLDCRCFLGRRQPEDFDCARLGATIKANAAACALGSHVMRWMYAVSIQFGKELKAFRWA